MGHFVFIKGHLWVIHSFGEIGFVICRMNCDWMVKTYFCNKKEQIQKKQLHHFCFLFWFKNLQTAVPHAKWNSADLTFNINSM